MSKVSVIKEACNKRFSEEIRSLREHRASGSKVIGYTCNFFPPSVAAGLGLMPVRVLCSTSGDSETEGERFVRPDVCPLVKCLLGNSANRKGIYSYIDLWAGLHTCDQMRRGMGMLDEISGLNAYPLQMPATRTKEAAEYYALQIRRFVSDMENLYKIRFDSDTAMRWQSEYEKAKAVLSGAVRSLEISPLDLHLMFHLFFISKPDGLADFFRKLISSSKKYRSEKTILLTGSPLALEDTVLLEVLEEKGFSVFPLNCTGLNSVEREGHSLNGKDEIESIALSAFYMPSCIRARPNTSVYRRIADTFKSISASGLIVKCLKFCDQWYTEKERMRKTFDVPVLVFDSDYLEGGRERLINRIEAFLETIR